MPPMESVPWLARWGGGPRIPHISPHLCSTFFYRGSTTGGTSPPCQPQATTKLHCRHSLPVPGKTGTTEQWHLPIHHWMHSRDQPPPWLKWPTITENCWHTSSMRYFGPRNRQWSKFVFVSPPRSSATKQTKEGPTGGWHTLPVTIGKHSGKWEDFHTGGPRDLQLY